jgi:thioredoxin-related protein
LLSSAVSPQTQKGVSAEEEQKLAAYLTSHWRSPEDYVVEKFSKYDIVFVGEIHRVKHDVELIHNLIPRLYKAGVYNLGIEFGRYEDQDKVDRLITADKYDEDLARWLQFKQFVGWGYKEYEDIYRKAWELNKSLRFYLLGLFRLMHDGKNDAIGSIRLLASLIFLSLTFWLLTGLFGSRLGEIESFLPPAIANSSSTESSRTSSIAGELEWITNNYESALSQARDQHKLLLIDFTGYTCTNCRGMEANMFTRSSVKKELENYVRVRLYTDGEGDSYRRQQEMQQSKYGTVALPYYAIVNGNGDTIASFPGVNAE